MPISFSQAGTFSGVPGATLQNPTSLQFGPDGRLYVSEQNGSVNAYTVSIQNGSYTATAGEELLLADGTGIVKSIQNHNDDGTENADGNRQVTGILVTGTAENPVLYVSSSDPQIAQNGEKNLDTNSGVVSRATWNGTDWVVVDLVRGLPRSEENHAVNGMLLSEDGTKLLLQVGGLTNNGAPSSFFSYTAEYALSGAILELDLEALDALPDSIDPNAGQGGVPRAYKYDLPTLDDPNIANAPLTVTQDFLDAAAALGGGDIGRNMTAGELEDFGIQRVAGVNGFPDAQVVITQELINAFQGIPASRLGTAFTDEEARAAGFDENGDGLDLNGPWGGNDGLNMTILPSDAPLKIYAEGTRNGYDLARTPDGKIYTVDNGSNGNLGDNPNTETTDDDGDGVPGEAINTPNNGGAGDPEPLFLVEEGVYFGHPNPVRSNQNMAWTVYNDAGNPDAAVSVNQVTDISALVPAKLLADGVMQAGFLIDPSKFATGPGQTLADLTPAEQEARLLQSGIRVPYSSSEFAQDRLGRLIHQRHRRL